VLSALAKLFNRKSEHIGVEVLDQFIRSPPVPRRGVLFPWMPLLPSARHEHIRCVQRGEVFILSKPLLLSHSFVGSLKDVVS
jgi:hypothetical protein